MSALLASGCAHIPHKEQPIVSLVELEEKINIVLSLCKLVPPPASGKEHVGRLADMVDMVIRHLERKKQTWRVIAYQSGGSPYLQAFARPCGVEMDGVVVKVLATDGDKIDKKLPLGACFDSYGEDHIDVAGHGHAIWLQISEDGDKPIWILQGIEGKLVNCVRMPDFLQHHGPIPDVAHLGQVYPKGMFSEGYGGINDVCVVSASGDNLWRELNKELLFRGMSTATVFEQMWGGDANFTDWVAYYALNVGVHAGLGGGEAKKLVVTTKNTRDYAQYPKFGPDVDGVKRDIGRAQYKECQWLRTQMLKKDMPWTNVQFMTTFQFMQNFANWSPADCQALALERVRLDLEEDMKAHHAEMAIACLLEAYQVPHEGCLIGSAADLAEKLTVAKIKVARDNETLSWVVGSLVDHWKGHPEVIGALSQGLRDKKLRSAAVKGLRAMHIEGDIAVQAIAQHLQDSSADIRQAAATALGAVVERGNATARAALPPALDDGDKDVQAAALRSLAALAPKNDEAAFELFTKRLQDTSSEVREAAESALCILLDEGHAVLVLAAIMEHEHEDVRAAAIRSISALAPKNEAAFKLLTKRLQDTSWKIREAAAGALGRLLDRGHVGAVLAFAPLMEDGEWRVRCRALRAMAVLAPKNDEAALGLLAKRVEDENWYVRIAAVRALEQLLDIGSSAARPMLARAMDDSDCSVRIEAVKIQAALAPKNDKAVLLILAQRLQDENAHVRASAVWALSVLSDTAEGLIRERMSQDGHKLVRWCAAGCLQSLGAHVDAAVWQAVVDGLESGNEYVRSAALAAVVVSQRRNAPSQELLRKCFEEKRRQGGPEGEDSHADAALMCGQFCTRGDTILVDLLLPLLDDGSEYLRGSVAEALARACEKGDAVVLERLRLLLADQEEFVRRHAEDALLELGG